MVQPDPPVATRVGQLAPGRLFRLLSEGHKYDAIDMALGVPERPVPSPVLIDEACAALRSGVAVNQYEAPEGNLALRSEIARRRSTPTDPATMVTVTAGATEGLFVAVLATVNPGDEVVILEPYSTLFRAPLIAALTDTVMRAAEHQAEQSGGRLDPPLVVCLDEAANICRIADLPELYSHLGSRGIIPVTILQSYEQGVVVWGEPGMAALWGAATRKVIGAGVDSPRLVRDLSTLIGQHDVPTRSITYGDGRTTEQISLRRQEILEPSAIRALPQGTALLLATGSKPALLTLRPWYTGPTADQISTAVTRADEAITVGARAFHQHREHPTDLEKHPT